MTRSLHKSRRGPAAYRSLTLSPRAVRAYHWIVQHVKAHGAFPTYYQIGEFAQNNAGSLNYYTRRNLGIAIARQLEAHGFVERKGRKLSLTNKPFSAGNLIE